MKCLSCGEDLDPIQVNQIFCDEYCEESFYFSLYEDLHKQEIEEEE
jgi:hypothetical protein